MAVKTALDRFIDTLKDRHTSWDNSSENKEVKRDTATTDAGEPLALESNPRHVHASGPNSANNLEFKCDAKCDQPVTLQVGSQVWWQAMNGRIYGPALIHDVSEFETRQWAWVTWDGTERAVCELLITAVEPGEPCHD